MSNADTFIANPAWFNADGSARRIPGPRVNPVDPAAEFVWGPCVSVHKLGEYTVLEYLDDRSRWARSRQDGHGRTLFHPFVGTKDLHTACHTIEEAITLAIAAKYDGDGSQAWHYFLRGVGAPTC